jgi:biopolymer transport protein TolR
MRTEAYAMPRKVRTSPRLFSDFNTLQFASVMAMVLFVLVLIFMFVAVPTHHYGVSVDVPKVSHPISMSSAEREDAMKITVTRDGKVYFGVEQVNLISLPEKIADHLKDGEVERKVYITADGRARYGTVKSVLDGVRSAGIIRVAFLVDQRRVPILTQ